MTHLKKHEQETLVETKTANGKPVKAVLPEKSTAVSLIPGKIRLADVNSACSKYNGQFIDGTDLELEVISYIEEFQTKEAHEIENLAVVISRGRALYQTHRAKSERSENIIDGVETKGKILQGKLLIIEKTLLGKEGKQWVDHYTQTYGQKSLRSAQDYMALGRIPNIIKYSPIGKERLMEAWRATKILEIESDDPIATLLTQHDIPFNPEDSQSEQTMTDLKLGIAYAVAVTKIKKAELKKEIELGVDPGLVKRLISDGETISNCFINDLFIINREGLDVNRHLEGLCSNEGNDDEMLSQIKRVERLPRLVANLKDAVEYLRQHSDLVARVERGDISDLETCVVALKRLIENESSTE